MSFTHVTLEEDHIGKQIVDAAFVNRLETYEKTAGILNFNVPLIKNGIKRIGL
jgi:hypothetical protein